MRLDRRVRLALAAVAMSLLVAGLAGPIRRALAPPAAVGSAELAPVRGPVDAARQEREARYRNLLAQGCTPDAALQPAGRLLAASSPSPDPASAPRRAARLPADEARAIVQARMREVTVPSDDWIGRMRSVHRARVLADYLDFAFAAPGEDGLCVWRVEGVRHDGARRLDYAMDLWLAPTPDLARLAADPATYVERER
jgi:hypothetical protein